MAQAGTLRSYLELCRASNLPTVWTNVLCAVVLSGAPWQPVAVLAAGAALTLIYLGGMALNDVLDVEEDRLRKPGRPIPSGRISRGRATLFALALFGAGLGLLALFTQPRATLAGVVLVLVVYLYDRLHRLSPVTVLLMAACRFLVFIVAALAVVGPQGPQGPQDPISRWVLVGATVQFFYIVALTAIARWEKSTTRQVAMPPIPWLLAGISLVDGVLLAVASGPAWLLAGLGGAVLTRAAQTQVRGD